MSKLRVQFSRNCTSRTWFVLGPDRQACSTRFDAHACNHSSKPIAVPLDWPATNQALPRQWDAPIGVDERCTAQGGHCSRLLWPALSRPKQPSHTLRYPNPLSNRIPPTNHMLQGLWQDLSASGKLTMGLVAMIQIALILPDNMASATSADLTPCSVDAPVTDTGVAKNPPPSADARHYPVKMTGKQIC